MIFEFDALDNNDYGNIPVLFDTCLSIDRSKLTKFLEKIYKIPFDKPDKWEPELFKFFSDNIIVPCVVMTSLKENVEEVPDHYLNYFIKSWINKNVMHFDTNTCYRDLIQIREYIRLGGNVKNYSKYLFMVNHNIRRMYVKKDDNNETRFKSFGVGMKQICYEVKKTNGIIYERTMFFLPDNGIEYPLENWHNKILKQWNIYLKSKDKKQTINKRDPIESRLRHEVFKRDNYKCLECAKSKKETTLHCDHILPVAQGGSDELDNLQTLCQACNLAKTNRKWKAGGKD